MQVLVCGGTYVHSAVNTSTEDSPQMRLVGGALLSTMIAAYSNHDVTLHTNFSTEEQKITKSYQQMLRDHYVSPNTVSKVSSLYGRIEDGRLISGTNMFETSDMITRSDKYHAFDVFVITTDISERDFRMLSRFAYEHGIKTFVITSQEYPIPVVYNGTTVIKLPVDGDEALIVHTEGEKSPVLSEQPDGAVYYKRYQNVESDTHLPVYHEYLDDIKNALHQAGIIEASKVKRYSKKPWSQPQKLWRFILQLVAAALIITGIGLTVLYAFDLFGGTNEYDTFVDDSTAVEHSECGTVGECRALGDSYLQELEDYINILDEPHVFFENRTRTTFVDYSVDDDLNLDTRTESNPIPVGSESDYTEIWERFSTIFPDEYLTDINTFRLFSDGEGNTLAYVEISEGGITLAVDIRDNASLAAEYRTLIHEFGHIYSLRPDDFDPACEDGTDLNCINEGTIMADYVERFWSQYGDNWLENSHKSPFEREAFYNNNITDFHVPYQATNAKEDYAVTFLRFIIEPMPDENSSQLKDVKVRSFYEDPELVALRTDILYQLLALEKERADT